MRPTSTFLIIQLSNSRADLDCSLGVLCNIYKLLFWNDSCYNPVFDS